MSNSTSNNKINTNLTNIDHDTIFIKNYEVIPIKTTYIEPNESLNKLINTVLSNCENEDYLIIAETPISVSQGRLVDENNYHPSLKSKFLANVWSKYIWGYFLGPLLGIKKRTIKNLRKLPQEAEKHKELVLDLYGWKHALKPASEAGIDLSNAPGTYVSLLPENPEKVAKEIAKTIKDESGKDLTVLIIDTDATYKIHNTYFTGLPIAIDPIKKNQGVFGYFFGQLGSNEGSTPLGCSEKIEIKEALKLANIAEEYQKSLETAMETIYSAKNVLNSEYDEVSVNSLESIIHTPGVLLREKN